MYYFVPLLNKINRIKNIILCINTIKVIIKIHKELVHKMLYVPEGCANGFQTLEDNTEAVYEITEVFKPKSSGGVRWDDPALGIKLPLPISKISKKDTSWDFL